MTALICGSLAFDTVMVFPGHFREHILADRIHMLNVSFLVPSMRRNFGGCAGNIAYNLILLGEKGAPMGTVGHDFEPYRRWLKACNVSLDYVRELDDEFTAQAFITTDIDDNQITAFHPGAMSQSHLNAVPTAAGITLGVVAPDGRDGMVAHALQFAAAGIPWLFDPGQGLPMFDGETLRDLIGKATWVAVNDYEGQMLQERTGWGPEEIAKRARAYIVTKGAEGSVIYADGEQYAIPTVKPEAVKDPTGCGDAYRAGLIFGLMNELDWETTGRIASLMGSIKIAHSGTQNHRFNMNEFKQRFSAAYGRELCPPGWWTPAPARAGNSPSCCCGPGWPSVSSVAHPPPRAPPGTARSSASRRRSSPSKSTRPAPSTRSGTSRARRRVSWSTPCAA
jgi:adenosine kinase